MGKRFIPTCDRCGRDAEGPDLKRVLLQVGDVFLIDLPEVDGRCRRSLATAAKRWLGQPEDSGDEPETTEREETTATEDLPEQDADHREIEPPADPAYIPGESESEDNAGDAFFGEEPECEEETAPEFGAEEETVSELGMELLLDMGRAEAKAEATDEASAELRRLNVMVGAPPTGGKSSPYMAEVGAILSNYPELQESWDRLRKALLTERLERLHTLIKKSAAANWSTAAFHNEIALIEAELNPGEAPQLAAELESEPEPEPPKRARKPRSETVQRFSTMPEAQPTPPAPQDHIRVDCPECGTALNNGSCTNCGYPTAGAVQSELL